MAYAAHWWSMQISLSFLILLGTVHHCDTPLHTSAKGRVQPAATRRFVAASTLRGEFNEPLCTAVAVNRRYALAPASCAITTGPQPQLFFTSSIDGARMNLKVEAWLAFVHPRWKVGAEVGYDAALLKLTTPIGFNPLMMAAPGYDPRKASGGLYALTAEDGFEMAEAEIVGRDACRLFKERWAQNIGCLRFDRSGSLYGDIGVVIVEIDPGADVDTVDWEFDWWDLLIGFTSGSNPSTSHTNATEFVQVSGIRDWAIKCIVQDELWEQLITLAVVLSLAVTFTIADRFVPVLTRWVLVLLLTLLCFPEEVYKNTLPLWRQLTLVAKLLHATSILTPVNIDRSKTLHSSIHMFQLEMGWISVPILLIIAVLLGGVITVWVKRNRSYPTRGEGVRTVPSRGADGWLRSVTRMMITA